MDGVRRSGWKPGQSGNPAGRKPGTGEVAKLRDGIRQHLPAIIEALVEKARLGDAAAAKLLLERVVPQLKPVEQGIMLELPDSSLTEKAHSVLKEIGQGAIGIGEGSRLLQAISTMARVTELDELAERIKALERLNGIT